MTAADESRVVWRHEIASVGLALGAAYLEGMAAARSDPPAEGLRECYLCGSTRAKLRLDGALYSCEDRRGCDRRRLSQPFKPDYTMADLDAATPPAEGLLWHDDVLCLGDACEVIDKQGNHPTPEADAAATPPAEGLDVRQERARIAAAWAEAMEQGEIIGIATANSTLLRILAEPYRLAPEQPE